MWGRHTKVVPDVTEAPGMRAKRRHSIDNDFDSTKRSPQLRMEGVLPVSHLASFPPSHSRNATFDAVHYHSPSILHLDDEDRLRAAREKIANAELNSFSVASMARNQVDLPYEHVRALSPSDDRKKMSPKTAMQSRNSPLVGPSHQVPRVLSKFDASRESMVAGWHSIKNGSGDSEGSSPSRSNSGRRIHTTFKRTSDPFTRTESGASQAGSQAPQVEDMDLGQAELAALYGYKRHDVERKAALKFTKNEKLFETGVTFKERPKDQVSRRNLLSKILLEAKSAEQAKEPGEDSSTGNGDKQQLRANSKLNSKFRNVAKKVINTKRITNTRGMDFWESLYKDVELSQGKWWSKPIDVNTVWVRLVQLATIVFVCSDIVIMFIEGVAFADWCRSGGDPRELVPGTKYVLNSINPKGSRTHQTFTFFIIKIVLGLCADFTYAIEILTRFHLVDHKRHSTTNTRIIAQRYFRGAFALDVFSSLPIYWIFIPIPWVRLNRFARLIFRWRDQFEIISFLGGYINMQFLRITFFFFWMCVWVHILACITSIMVLDTPDVNDALRWMSMESPDFVENSGSLYLRSVLFSWAQLANGQGDMGPQNEHQMLWTLFSQVVGTFVYMVVLGKVVSILQNIDLNAAEFNSHRDMVNTFLRIRDVPSGIRKRVNLYFDALWDRKRGMDEHEIFRSLPPFLRHDLSWSINRHFLQKVPMFIGADASALMIINQFLTHMVITQKEILLRGGEVSDCMYFVISGQLAVLDIKGRCVAELSEGSVVGEVGILLNKPAEYDVQAKTTCDVFRLTAHDFDQIIAVFPSFKTKLIKRAEKLYGLEWKAWMLELEERARQAKMALLFPAGSDTDSATLPGFQETFRSVKPSGLLASARLSSKFDTAPKDHAAVLQRGGQLMSLPNKDQGASSLKHDETRDATQPIDPASPSIQPSPNDETIAAVEVAAEKVVLAAMPPSEPRAHRPLSALPRSRLIAETAANPERTNSEGSPQVQKLKSNGVDSPLLFHWAAAPAAPWPPAQSDPNKKGSSSSPGLVRRVQSGGKTHELMLERLEKLENKTNASIMALQKDMQGRLSAMEQVLDSKLNAILQALGTLPPSQSNKKRSTSGTGILPEIDTKLSGHHMSSGRSPRLQHSTSQKRLSPTTSKAKLHQFLEHDQGLCDAIKDKKETHDFDDQNSKRPAQVSQVNAKTTRLSPVIPGVYCMYPPKPANQNDPSDSNGEADAVVLKIPAHPHKDGTDAPHGSSKVDHAQSVACASSSHESPSVRVAVTADRSNVSSTADVADHVTGASSSHESPSVDIDLSNMASIANSMAALAGSIRIGGVASLWHSDTDVFALNVGPPKTHNETMDSATYTTDDGTFDNCETDDESVYERRHTSGETEEITLQGHSHISTEKMEGYSGMVIEEMEGAERTCSEMDSSKGETASSHQDAVPMASTDVQGGTFRTPQKSIKNLMPFPKESPRGVEGPPTTPKTHAP